MPDAKGFDIIRQGLNSAIDIYSKSADADFRDEHEIRQTIAKGIIKDRNNLLYSDINNKLIEDIANTTHRVNWSDQLKVDEARDTIFGKEGLIATAKSTFSKRFTKIPDAPNEDLNDKLILFDRQNLTSGDVFTQIERKEVEARLINNFNRTMQSDIASIPESLREIEIGDEATIKDLTMQVSQNVDNALLLVNDQVNLTNASEGEAQGILKTAARFDPHTSQGIRAFAFQSIAIALVESGRDEDALDFVQQLELEDTTPGGPVEGIASYVLGESTQTIAESIRSLIVESYNVDQKEIGGKARETNVNISNLEKASFNVTQYEDVIPLDPEIRAMVDNAESAIAFMKDGINDEFARLDSVSQRLYGQPSSEVRKVRMQFRNASLIKNLKSVQSTDVSNPSSSNTLSPGKSLAVHISDVSAVSGKSNTDYSVLSAAIASTIKGGGFTSGDFLHIEPILRSLNKENKPIADSLYQHLKEQANSNESFLSPSIDQENNDQARMLRHSRSVEDYFKKIDILNNAGREEPSLPFRQGTENYWTPLSGVIAIEGKNSTHALNGKEFVGSLSLTDKTLLTQTQDMLDNNPELSVDQAFAKAKRGNTKSLILGNVSGTGGMDASLVETLTVGILISEGASGIEATGSSQDHQRRLVGLELIPVSLESNPKDNTFMIWNTNGGYWENGRDGSQIRFQLGSMVNNDLFKTAEDLEVNLQAFDGATSITGDLQLDQALRMTDYRGGEIGPIDNLMELTGRYINSFEINNYTGIMPAGYEHYDEDDDIAWLRSTSGNGMLTPNMPGYHGETARLNLLLNPSDYDIKIIEETMGPALAKKFLDTGTTFRHLLDVGIVRSDAQRIAYEYKKLYEELAIRLSIDSESGIDLNDYDGIYVLDLLTQDNPQLNSIANKRLEEIVANDPDQEFLPIRAIEVVQEAIQDTFDSSVDLLRNVLTENAIIPESDFPSFSETREINRESRNKNNPVPKADQDLFNTLLKQNSEIVYDKDSEYTSVTSALGRAEQTEEKTVTIVKAKDGITSVQNTYEEIVELVASGKSFTYDQSPDGKTVKVTKVKDGDTFVILKDMAYRVSTVTGTNGPKQDGSILVKETVRFTHTDTPETAKYYRGQYADRGGREAYEFTLKALNGKTVRFEPFVNPDGTLGRGHHKRALGTVITGRFGDHEIASVSRGLATFRPSAEAMSPEEQKRVSEIQEAQAGAKLLGIGLWRRPVKGIMSSNENFFLKMHNNVLSKGKQRVNKDGSVTTMLITSISLYDGSNDTFLVPGYNPETGKNIDYKNDGIPQFVMDAIEKGELYAYPNVATAERHRESFYPGIVEGDKRKLYTRNRVLKYFSSSHKWNVNKQVEKINNLTSSWDFEDFRMVMDSAYDEDPRRIPSLDKLRSLYKRHVTKISSDLKRLYPDY